MVNPGSLSHMARKYDMVLRRVSMTDRFVLVWVGVPPHRRATAGKILRGGCAVDTLTPTDSPVTNGKGVGTVGDWEEHDSHGGPAMWRGSDSSAQAAAATHSLDRENVSKGQEVVRYSVRVESRCADHVERPRGIAE